MTFMSRLLAMTAAMVTVPGLALAVNNENWALGLTEPVTPLARDMLWFHNDILLPLIIAISVFVLVLLIYVCVRFSEKNNPEPSTTSHHVGLEIAWTMIPVLILVVIAFPSLKLLYATDRIEDAEMTLKVTGHQWYWSYEYPDHEGIAFEAYMLEEEEGQENRLMRTDNVVVLPVDTTVRLQFTSADVIHNWAMSSFGVRVDTIPGRLNEAWTRVEKEGTYYGFCSELCGVNHAYMPIEVKVVSKEEFKKWVAWAKEEFASADSLPQSQFAKSETVETDGELAVISVAKEN